MGTIVDTNCYSIGYKENIFTSFIPLHSLKKKKLKKYVTKFIIFQNSLASPNSPLKKANV